MRNHIHNEISFTGTICDGPRIRYTPKGTEILEFTVDVRDYRDSIKVHESVHLAQIDRINCKAYGTLAAEIDESTFYVNPGYPVEIDGVMRVVRTEKDGRTTVSQHVKVERFEYIADDDEDDEVKFESDDDVEEMDYESAIDLDDLEDIYDLDEGNINDINAENEKIVEIDGVQYRETPTGQYEPLVEYTSDPYEKELLKRPIGHYGRLWQEWIENQHSFIYKSKYIRGFTWPIIPRIIDEKAEKRHEELDEWYRKTYPEPNGEDTMESIKWQNRKSLYIENRILEELVHIVYDFNDPFPD